MPRRMRISRSGIELIKSFEGFHSRTVRVDDEHWVIGFGHVRKSKDKYRVSRDEADQILREYDLPPFEALVLESTYSPLHQGAFDALVSFAFNIGKEAFLSSDVLALLNAGETIAAAEAMGAWRKAKIEGRTIIVDALVRRRSAEKAMFLDHPSGPAPAPSAIVRPKLDLAAAIMTPRERAVVIETSVDGDEARAFARAPEQERRSPRTTTIAEASHTERLTRRFEDHLGEEDIPPPPPPPNVDPNAGPTPEEITAAISELVNGAQGEADLQDVEDLPGIDIDLDLQGDIDLDPLPEADFVTLDEAKSGPRFERTLGDEADAQNLPDADLPPIIDDLETVEIADEDIQRAMKIHDEMESDANGSGVPEWGRFALFAMIGAGILGWGMSMYHGNDRSIPDAAMTPELALIIIGAVLFVVMAYYFMRAFIKASE